jgi:hypothetical protein
LTGEVGSHAAAARSIATNGAISSAGATTSRPARSIARFLLVVAALVVAALVVVGAIVVDVGISNSPRSPQTKKVAVGRTMALRRRGRVA